MIKRGTSWHKGVATGERGMVPKEGELSDGLRFKPACPNESTLSLVTAKIAASTHGLYFLFILHVAQGHFWLSNWVTAIVMAREN